MSFLPEEPEDAFWFAVAPLTTFPIALYSISGYLSGRYPYGKPDWESNARNAILWLGTAGAVYAWNFVWSPHNLKWVSGSTAFKTVGQYWAGSGAVYPTAMLLLAAAGTAAQFDVAAHHGAGTRGSPGSIAPSYHLVDGKPWWEQY